MTGKARVILGADDAGFALKETIKEHLVATGAEVVDAGCYSAEAIDYPDVAEDVATRVASGEYERAILICGTGIGMSIVANKIPGVRAALCHDTYSAERARKSNNAQVLTMGARVIGPELAKQIADAWMQSEFAGGASARKVEKIGAVEERHIGDRTDRG